MDSDTKSYITTKLKNYFHTIPREIDDLKEQIYIEQQKASVKGVSFDKSGGSGGISNDEKLAIISDNINRYEIEIQKKIEEADDIVRKLHLYQFTDEELYILERVAKKEAKKESLKSIGRDIGYVKQSVYHKANVYYDRIDKAMQKDKGIE